MVPSSSVGVSRTPECVFRYGDRPFSKMDPKSVSTQKKHSTYKTCSSDQHHVNKMWKGLELWDGALGAAANSRVPMAFVTLSIEAATSDWENRQVDKQQAFASLQKKPIIGLLESDGLRRGRTIACRYRVSHSCCGENPQPFPQATLAGRSWAQTITAYPQESLNSMCKCPYYYYIYLKTSIVFVLVGTPIRPVS